MCGWREGWCRAGSCTVSLLSRSFENNWKIYKLLAHQKVSKEKVREGADVSGAMRWVRQLPASSGLVATTLPAASRGVLNSRFGAGEEFHPPASGLSLILRPALSFACGYRAPLQHSLVLLKNL